MRKIILKTLLLLLCEYLSAVNNFLIKVSEDSISLSSEYNRDELLTKYKYGICNAEYSPEDSLLIMILPEISSRSISQRISSIKDVGLNNVVCFGSKGNFLTEVGIKNSYVNGGIVTPCYLYMVGKTLFINDSATKRISAFKIEKSRNTFNYSIDISDIFSGGNFLVRNDFLFGSTPIDLSENHNTVVVSQILTDSDYSQSKKANVIRYLLSSTEYQKEVNPYYKKFCVDKGIENSPYFNPVLQEVILTGGLYTISNFCIADDLVFMANSYGTEFVVFNCINDSIEVNSIESFKEMRELCNKLSFSLNDYRDASSKLRKIFVDKQRKYLYLYYYLNSNVAEELGFNKCLLVHSYESGLPVTEILPIDFIPVGIDSNMNRIVGIEMRNNKVFLCKYSFSGEE